MANVNLQLIGDAWDSARPTAVAAVAIVRDTGRSRAARIAALEALRGALLQVLNAIDTVLGRLKDGADDLAPGT